MGTSSAQEMIDYDADDDGLIEISYLEQLNAIRWDLEGNGHADTPPSDEAYDSALPMSVEDAYEAAYPGAVEGMGCPDTCIGYELAGDMDFQDPTSYQAGTTKEEWTEGRGWLPISKTENPYKSNEVTDPQRHRAVLEGNRFTLSNLFIDMTDESISEDDGYAQHVVGLFATTSGDIRSLTIEGANVKAISRVGALAGRSLGSIEAVWVSNVKVSSPEGQDNTSFGGIVGWNTGSIKDSTASGAIVFDGIRGGGLVGYNDGEITGSHSTADVSGLLKSYRGGPEYRGGGDAGGLVGDNAGNISHSWAVSTVKARSGGGFVGRNEGEITQSYAESNVEGRTIVGGFAGSNKDLISESWAESEVSNTGRDSGNAVTGGFVGWNWSGTILASFAVATVAADRGAVGGLVGVNASDGVIEASYAVGDVRLVQGNRIGGLVGSNSSGSLGLDNPKIRYSFSLVAVDENQDSDQGGFVGVANGTIVQGYWLREPPISISSAAYGSTEGVVGMASAQLKEAADYTGIYADWNENNKNYWDFGDETHYPALRIIGPDGTTPDQHGRTVAAPEPTPTPAPEPAPTPTPDPALRVAPTATGPSKPSPTSAARQFVGIPQPGPTVLPMQPISSTSDSDDRETTGNESEESLDEAATGGCGSAGALPVETAAVNLLLMLMPVGLAGTARFRNRKKRSRVVL